MIATEQKNGIKKYLLDYVQKLTGENGRQTKDGHFLFKSPFRTEETPSFSVSISLNKWHDFGTNQSGDIFDLYSIINRDDNFSNAVLFFLQGFNFSSQSYEPIKKQIDKEFKILSDFENKDLLGYAYGRGISMATMRKYCVEVDDSKGYHYIGFRNDKGGYELRNGANFKGSFGEKSITTIMQSESSSVYVFEGFFDFLSIAEFRNDFNAIVLNSTSLVKSSINALQGFKTIVLMLDNDMAGKNALESLKMAFSGTDNDFGKTTILDYSQKYAQHNDVNAFLVYDRCAFVRSFF